MLARCCHGNAASSVPAVKWILRGRRQRHTHVETDMTDTATPSSSASSSRFIGVCNPYSTLASRAKVLRRRRRRVLTYSLSVS